jgi:predicted dithiol-disulfide oxidoreductase (DUF899 family)
LDLAGGFGHVYVVTASPASVREFSLRCETVSAGPRTAGGRKDIAMTPQAVGTHDEWLRARVELLEAEKELTRRSDELARRRQELPWVRIDKEYGCETDERSASLADLFRERSQLLVYHFMFGPDFTAGCPSCSAIADGFNGSVVHLANHDVTLCAVSRAPIEKLQAFKQRMGWTFPWASSFGSNFNYDFQASYTEEQQRSGVVEYNFRTSDVRPSLEAGKEGPLAEIAATVGTDWATYTREAPGMSAFALEDGVVYHTYSAYARGLDGLWSMYQWLDRAPRGRNEDGFWWAPSRRIRRGPNERLTAAHRLDRLRWAGGESRSRLCHRRSRDRSDAVRRLSSEGARGRTRYVTTIGTETRA